MTYFGMLKKKYSEAKINEHISFESKTTNQINALKTLATFVKRNAKVKKAIEENNESELSSIIANDNSLSTQLDRYFGEYGGRFANELKLESPDIEENKLEFFKLLKNYENITISNTSNQIKDTYLFRKFKKYAAQREEFRLLRSNAFSIVRKTFNRIGYLLWKENKLDNPKDIFYLTINEIIQKEANLKDIISNRKVEYENFKNIDPPTFFGVINGEKPDHSIENNSSEKDLKGRGCTKGETIGKIKVFKEYHLPENINFDIAVAKHTDPGWTPLLGFCKGLIIENGGILSHAAIVSRELGIPTVIGVKNATKKLKNGQTVKINGSNGEIQLINKQSK